ncbi:MAG: alkaline phosphatase family protein [Armatimonadota bacterium]|nr:alkaline phosphatase family protein [Armatimonadota bacterium]
MRRCSILLLLIVFLLSQFALPPASAAVHAAPDGKLIILSWDAAGDWIMDRLLAQGKMPNMARLARQGVRAEYVVPPFPSLTAPGHAALWTGSSPDVNGIVYNSVSPLPRSEHTILETMSGFDSRALLAEPVWMAAVKSGKRALLLSAAQSEPFDVYYSRMAALRIPRDHLIGIQGRFDRPLAPAGIYTKPKATGSAGIPNLPRHNGRVLRVSGSIEKNSFNCFLFDAKADSKRGYDTAVIMIGKRTPVLLKPGWSSPRSTDKFSSRISLRFGATVASVRFRLFALAPDGSSCLLYHTPALRTAFSVPTRRPFPLASWGEGRVPFDEYEHGKLGRTLWTGGNGDAERRLTELIRLSVSRLRSETRSGIKGFQWDLLMHYSPMPDAFEHIIMGFLDDQSRAYRPELARKLWPYLAETYRIHDEWIGDLLALRPKNCLIALVSDHGMQGVSREFYPNSVLRDAGLLAVGVDGKIDLARTKALVPPWYPGFGVVVNDKSWKGGIVAMEERAVVIEAAENALMAAVDAETGVKPVKRMFKSPNPEFSLGGPRTVDFAFDLERDYWPERDVRETVAGGTKPGRGAHGFVPSRPRMWSIFIASGPGLGRSVTLPPMPATNVIPTLCKALGWTAPGNSLDSSPAFP